MYVDDDEEEARAMNLKNEILAGESYLLGFRLALNEDRIKYLKTVVAFANGRGDWYGKSGVTPFGEMR
jgi:hypothetical protein